MSILTIHRAKRLLGVCLGERALHVAEVVYGNSAAPTARTMEFAYPPGMSLENARALGHEFGQFLKREGFAARQVVFGVPAKWLILRAYEMPPTDPATAADVLWLHATEHGWPELGPMVFDFAGQSHLEQSTTLLLMGLQERWMDRVLALADGAGLKAVSVTPSGVSLADVTARHIPSALIVSLRSEGAELVILEHSQIRLLRHISANGNTQPLIRELRRAAAASPLDADPHIPGEKPGRNLVLWDDVGAEPELLNSISAAASAPLVQPENEWGEAARSDPSSSPSGLSAIALTLAVRNNRAARVDFLHPRLAAPAPVSINRRAAWLTVASIILAVVLAAYIDLGHIKGQIFATDSQLQSMAPALEIARPFVANMAFAESFQTGNPRYLSCIRDLTLAVDSDPQTTFVSFHLGANMAGDVDGRASTEQDVLNLMDKLRTGGRFADLQCKLDARASKNAASNDVSFLINFIYLPHK